MVDFTGRLKSIGLVLLIPIVGVTALLFGWAVFQLITTSFSTGWILLITAIILTIVVGTGLYSFKKLVNKLE